MIYERKVWRYIFIILVNKGLLQKSTVIVTTAIINGFRQQFAAAIHPTAGDSGKLMFNRYVRLYGFHTGSCEIRILCHPQIPAVYEVQPVRILPVNFTWKLLTGLLLITFPAACTIAHLREKGHIKEHSLKIIHGIHFREAGLHILPVLRIVRTDNSISSALKIFSMPVFTHHLSLCRNQSPGWMLFICPVIKNLRKVRNYGNSVFMTGFHHITKKIIPFKSPVHPSDLCRIVAQSGMRLALYHRSLNACILQGFHILLHIDFGKKLRIPVINMHVH